MDITIFLIIIFVLAIAVLWWQIKWKNNIKNKIFDENNFDVLDFVMPFETNSLLAINKNKIKILIYDFKNAYMVELKNIISLEIFENGNSVAKTNFTSQAGRIIVGGVVAGGIGAIIGGLSGSSTSIEKVKEISLKITTDDYDNPNHKIFFIDKKMSGGVNKGSLTYNKAIEDIELWHSRLTNLIKEKSAI